jgi:hypothetical protein
MTTSPPLRTTAVRGLTIRWPSVYRWHPGRWVGPILAGFDELGVRVERADLPQPYQGIVVFEASVERGSLPIVLDYFDAPELNEGAVAEAALYFKMQFDRAGYSDPGVVPGGYVAGNRELYRRLRLFRQLRRLPRRSDVYARFGLRFGAELRCRAVEVLRERPDLTFAGGLTHYEGGPPPISYRRYLHELGRARMALDLPGRGDLCFRLVEALALGVCVIRPSSRVQLHVPLVAGEQVVECSADLEDLGDVCSRLVRDDAERERIARNGREYFDRYLGRRQLAAYYVHEILRVAEGLDG